MINNQNQNQLNIVNGSFPAPALSFSNDNNIGMYYTGGSISVGLAKQLLKTTQFKILDVHTKLEYPVEGTLEYWKDFNEVINYNLIGKLTLPIIFKNWYLRTVEGGNWQSTEDNKLLVTFSVTLNDNSVQNGFAYFNFAETIFEDSNKLILYEPTFVGIIDNFKFLQMVKKDRKLRYNK